MLITKVDISKHRELSKSVRDSKINPYIEDAEHLDLKPLLGRIFYYDIVNNKEEPKYNELLTGNDEHSGLKKVLALFANARYVLHGSFTDTPFGFVEKNGQNSQPVSSTSKRDIYSKDRQAAMAYFTEVSMWLDNNKNEFPKWRKECQSKPTGFRISKIS